MRRLLLLFFLFFIFVVSAVDIDVRLKASYEGVYVASYYGKGVRVIDSLFFQNGTAQWQRDDVPEGVYFLADKNGSQRYDFLLGEDQDLTITLNDLGVHGAMVRGAIDSEMFLRYQQFMADGQRTDDERSFFLRKVLTEISDASFLALMVKALLPPTDPPAVLAVNSMAAYDYRIAHFWENYDLTDARLMRTPFFAQRFDYFLNQVLLPREDKMREALLPLLAQAEGSDEILRLLAAEALGVALENKIMGIDALGFEVISRYYLSGRLGELPPKQRQMLEDYVKYTGRCRVGQKGQEILLESWDEHQVSLYETPGEYTLLLFWEPDCEYCKVVLPVLKNEVLPQYKARGLQIFAVNTQKEYDLWKTFILKNELFDWSHGYLPVGVAEFMVDYGVQGTPYMYILDKDKKIVAKNVKLEFLDQMLSRLFASGSIY